MANLKKTEENLKDDYWKNMFDVWGLTNMFYNFPRGEEEIKNSLNLLRTEYVRPKK